MTPPTTGTPFRIRVPYRTAMAAAAGLVLVGAVGGAPTAAHARDLTAVCAGTLSYSLDTSATASQATRHVVVADLDGDGAQDVAAANLDADSVTVLLGNGDGTFAEGGTYAVGTRPHQTVVADFDGDARPDLATADFGGARVSMLSNTGDGTFATASALAVGQSPRALATGDLDGDGVADLVVAEQGPSTVRILLGNGDGTFEDRGRTATGSRPHGVVIGDFDGDGAPDVATASVGSAGVSVLLGDGAGGLAPRPSTPPHRVCTPWPRATSTETAPSTWPR